MKEKIKKIDIDILMPLWEKDIFDDSDDGIAASFHVKDNEESHEILLAISNETINDHFNMNIPLGTLSTFFKYEYTGLLHNSIGPAQIFYRKRDGRVIKKFYYLDGKKVKRNDLIIIPIKKIIKNIKSIFLKETKCNDKY